ncbi:MAG: S41 family peptidase [Longimicrobiales bacterium]
MRPWLATVLAAVATAAACAPSYGPAAAQLPGSFANAPVTRDEALAVFDSAWTRIHRSHYDSTFNGVDWSGVRSELRPRAESVRTTGALRSIIQEMLGRLGQSHFGLIPREFADAVDPEALHLPTAASERPGDVGMELRLHQDRVVVSSIVAGGPADLAGLHPGWTLEAIDGRRLSDGVARLAYLAEGADRRTGLTRFLYSMNARLDGPAASHVTLRVRDGSDRVREIELVRREQPGEAVRIGNLPTLVAALEYRRVDAAAGCTGIIRFNVWMIPLVREFDRAVDALRGCAGIVVDLRGNPGGVAGMLMGIAGHFLEEPVPLGVMRSRTGELRFVANPRRVSAQGQAVRPYGGPIAILVDAMTASTSEFFAGGMQAIGRARVFGETSAGQALPAVVHRLPNQDVLMYVVADYADPRGRRFEGAGVVPDVAVPLRAADLLAGRDAALDAALSWIAGARRTSS